MWDKETSRPRNLLTFRAGGWVLVLMGVLAVVVVLVTVRPALLRLRDRPPGDGRDPATYGFDLSVCLIPREQILAGQFHRDLLTALNDPPVIPGTAVDELNAVLRREKHLKYLVSSDRIVGVAIDGAARAYPLRLLTGHEVVNDTLGGRPIAVTYNPLCDSVAVFDRTVSGEVLEFGVSGLVYNSNHLLYDRRPDMQGESLWSQLQARAIAGPAAAAGRRLNVVPVAVTQWADWYALHPDTEVLEPDPDVLKLRQMTSYAAYLRDEKLKFPVDPAPPVDAMPLKTPCVVVTVGGERRMYPLPYVASQADEEGAWEDMLGGEEIKFHVLEDPPVARLAASDDGPPPVAVYGLWFALYAMDPEVEVAGEPLNGGEPRR